MKNNSIQRQIHEFLKQKITKDYVEFEILETTNEKQFLKLFFVSYRTYKNDPKYDEGLELTNFGFNILKKYFDNYDISCKDFSLRDKLYLNINSIFPYYYERYKLYLFDTNLASKIMLCGSIEDCRKLFSKI